MSDDKSSWLENAFGFVIDTARQGVQSVEDTASSAVDEDARKQLGKDLDDDWNKAKGVASFVGNAVIDPQGTGEKIGKQIRAGYDQAAATGRAAGFIGTRVGQAAVVVASMAVGAGEAEAAGLVAEG